PDPPPPPIYTLSLHDALPISHRPQVITGPAPTRPWAPAEGARSGGAPDRGRLPLDGPERFLSDQLHDVALEPDERLRGEQVDGADRKSTRLNSSHVSISYAVF